ncbi:hypothetical protein AmaxDRAFT_1636 [Limnospira maxima CS-328]|uniref:Uncharacterized protein n=1 Tax=Limnospira maxima CS-328 TaxID=513049 RepID=B5VYP4_LIMMA|nr:hypothetical protein AmaxDRAFT_1636 [Limnospira maxima CS-328]
MQYDELTILAMVSHIPGSQIIDGNSQKRDDVIIVYIISIRPKKIRLIAFTWHIIGIIGRYPRGLNPPNLRLLGGVNEDYILVKSPPIINKI